MHSYKEIDIQDWERKSQYNFFKSFDDPFFNITSNVDIGHLPGYVQEKGYSFNLACLFYSQQVIHSIPEFRLRMEGEKVILFDKVNCGSTILLDDHSFSYCYFEYDDNLETFDRKGKQNIELLRRQGDFNPRDGELDNIHYSSLPWIPFTAIKHARRFGITDSIPKIVFGKWYEDRGRQLLPVAVDVHHALLDGYHLGLYFSRLSEAFSKL